MEEIRTLIKRNQVKATKVIPMNRSHSTTVKCAAIARTLHLVTNAFEDLLNLAAEG
jgi:hypothetical protein